MKHNQGFTLVELAIVLLIISFITGSVMLGQELIRNAQLRSVNGEYERYTQALKNFRSKYLALPGDFATAETIWGASVTDNGDGNGRIINQDDTDTYPEQFTAWQQLALAGMIEGDFTGATVLPNLQNRVPGTNIPASQLSSAGWGLVSLTLSDLDPLNSVCANIPYYTGDIAPNHVLWLGGPSAAATCNTQAPVLTAEEAQLLDEKIDDGIPGTGKIVAQSGGTCTSSDSAYNITASGLLCALVFKTGL